MVHLFEVGRNSITVQLKILYDISAI